MILVDTSVWVDHLRQGVPELAALLDGQEVLVHPYVVGELVLGGLGRQREVVALLQELPAPVVAESAEVLALVEHEALWGRGIGYVDAALLASARLTTGARLWSRDRRLAAAADALGVGERLG
ncbi:MAG: type toxin-antitoxin system VapC family toxin [Frankiales bacterium]|nr:type toxin-antitoxin system VapC family toxin [Frankiales bacterium]